MSDDFMKSALDRAMERADRIEIPEKKLKEMEYRSDGERIAAGFMKEPEYDLPSALKEFDPERLKHVSRVVESILLNNLVLPRKDSDLALNEKVLKGISALKKDKNTVQQAEEQLKNLSSYYAQARKQNYEQLKSEVERAMAQAIQQRTGASPEGNLNVEQTQEFQENWRQLSARLNTEYEKALDELRQRIASAT